MAYTRANAFSVNIILGDRQTGNDRERFQDTGLMLEGCQNTFQLFNLDQLND